MSSFESKLIGMRVRKRENYDGAGDEGEIMAAWVCDEKTTTYFNHIFVLIRLDEDGSCITYTISCYNVWELLSPDKKSVKK